MRNTWKQLASKRTGIRKGIIDEGNKKCKGIEEGAYLAYLKKSNEVSAAGIEWDNWRVTGQEAREGPDQVRPLKVFCLFSF